MATLNTILAGAFAAAGVLLGIRTIVRRRRGPLVERRRRDRRRLASLGEVDAHRERYR